MRWHLVAEWICVPLYNIALRTFQRSSQSPADIAFEKAFHYVHSVSALISCWAIGKVCWSPSKITWYDPVAGFYHHLRLSQISNCFNCAGRDREIERYLLWQEVVNWNSAAISIPLGRSCIQAAFSRAQKHHTNEFPAALSQNLAHQND